jgi:hypothetical protein
MAASEQRCAALENQLHTTQTVSVRSHLFVLVWHVPHACGVLGAAGGIRDANGCQ